MSSLGAGQAGLRGGLTRRLGTHNVGGGATGLASRMPGALAAWQRMHLDIVAVQEVRASFHELWPLMRQATEAGYVMHGGIKRDNPRSAGVGVLYKRSLVTAGTITRVGEPWFGPRPWEGHVLALPLDWGGHQLLVASLYVPNTNPSAFLGEVLPSLLRLHPTRQLVLLGDFNFVEDPQLDRWRAPQLLAAAHAPTPGDAVGPAALAAAAPGFKDAFRCLHPHRRAYTHHGVSGAARLDRVYVPEALCTYLHRCWVGSVSPSDHRPLAVSLTAAGERRVRGRGLQRLRMPFWAASAQREEFQQCVEQQASQAPADPAALRAWWPQFKRALAAKVVALNKQAALPSSPAAWAAERQTRQRLAATYAAADSGDAQAHASVPRCRGEWMAAAARARRAVASTTQPTWLHANELPSPVMTERLRPHSPRVHIAALRAPHGGLVPPGVQQADVLAAHYAAISAEPPQDPAAAAEVLAAASAGARFTPPQADAMGAAGVTPGAVAAALKHSPSGKAPGLDGIPVELYRRCSGVMAPLLARVYSAMGELGCTPVGFLDGAISAIHKGGDITQPAKHRPITLLNTDYRVLAKVLANRLLACMAV